MATGDDEGQDWKLHLGCGDCGPGAENMTLNMVNPNQRLFKRITQRPGRFDANNQRRVESRASGDGNRVDRGPGFFCLAQGTSNRRKNRESVLTSGDLEIMAVLAHNASLAVANARLVKRLRAAEERLKKENAFLKGREQERRSGARGAQAPQIIGQSSPMKQLFAQLEKVVNTRVTVLIEGETGVGKELVAASVHYRSNRKDRLFVGQNCAAMPETLLESELFGHKKGSFTGAHEDKKGLFEIADGGTLFLDEVTEMPLSLQSKLLRVLQEGEVRPIGATQEKKVNVRIVAATNRNLEKEVAEGRFREDLYYRLKVFPLRVPPLREPREDIPPIAEHFLHPFASQFVKPSARLPPSPLRPAAPAPAAPAAAPAPAIAAAAASPTTPVAVPDPGSGDRLGSLALVDLEAS